MNPPIQICTYFDVVLLTNTNFNIVLIITKKIFYCFDLYDHPK